MKLVRTVVLTAVAAVCLCRCVFSGEPTLAPPPPRPQPAGSAADCQVGTTPTFISARSIRVAAPLDKIDALLGSLAGKNATDARISIHCDKIEIVRGGSDSFPEIECFGDVIVKGRDFSLHAERVLKRGNSLTFEGTTGKPVQIVSHKSKALVHVTAMEVSFDLSSGRAALADSRSVETRKTISTPKDP